MKKFHLTYITTNVITGKQYVGDHSTDNINDSYLGSGLLLLKSISKYGKENFERKILKICESKKEAFDLQEKYINEYNTLYPNGYNISPKGGHNVKGCFSEESKRKISINRKGKHKGKEHSNFGKPLSESTKRKIAAKNKINSKGCRNGMYENNQYSIWIEKYGIEEANKRYYKWKKKISKTQSGKITSDHTKLKQKVAAINRTKFLCPHCNKQFDSGNLNQHIKSLERKGIVDSYWVMETLRDKESII